MLPTREEAIRELQIAGEMNPGPWTRHCANAAQAAEYIARGCGMDPERAFVLGLLHDIGRRTGIAQMRHIIDGYDFCMARGWQENARICLTHSFPVKDIDADIAKRDVTPAQEDFVRHYLEGIEYDNYDRLIILCDSLANASGFCNLEKRFVDTALRYGLHSCTLDRWRKTLEIKAYFDDLAGGSVYRLLPGIERCFYEP